MTLTYLLRDRGMFAFFCDAEKLRNSILTAVPGFIMVIVHSEPDLSPLVF